MGTLNSNFPLWALQDIFGTGTNQLGLGDANGAEVSGGGYARASNSSAGWSITTESGRATAKNTAKFFFPANETASSYTAAQILAFAKRGGSALYKVYAHAFKLGPLTISQNTRVKINAYDASTHRGLFIQLWEA